MRRRHIIDNRRPTECAPRHDRGDVAVIGAGPAGAWAAYRLARAGARVTIFDASHPREKPCGGGVTGRALALLGDAPELRLPPATAITQARFARDRGAPVTVAIDDLIVTSRRELDAALLAAATDAGARLVAERVEDVRVDASGASVVTRLGRHATSLVLGADGANSLVRRRLFRPFRRRQLSIAAGYFADAAAPPPSIVLQFTSSPPGYFWSFPRPDHVALGGCAPADGAASGPLRHAVSAWMTDGAAAASVGGWTGAPRRYGWPIPSLSPVDLDAEPVAGRRWMLLGDAAGLVDPITREGIFFALQSAEIGARAIMAADDPTAAYDAGIRSEIHPELRRAGRLQAAFFRPAFTGLLVEALEQSHAVRSVMSDLVAGRQPYRGLRRRLLGTLELGLAFRLLWQGSRPTAGLTARVLQ